MGRVDLAFILDCEELYLQERLLRRGKETGRVDDNINAIATRIAFFKQNTLPVVKHFDDQGKLVVVGVRSNFTCSLSCSCLNCVQKASSAVRY